MASSVLPTSTAPRLFPLTSPSTHGQRLLAMLRYRPSLEFSPAVAPSQSNALVPSDSAIPQPPIVSGDETQSVYAHDATAAALRSRMQSLLDFVCEANENEKATVTLDSFLRQVQDERGDLEAAFEKKAATAAVHLVESLVRSLPSIESAVPDADPDDDDNLSDHTDVEEPSQPNPEDAAAASVDDFSRTVHPSQLPEKALQTTMNAIPYLTETGRRAVNSESKAARKGAETRAIEKRIQMFSSLDTSIQQQPQLSQSRYERPHKRGHTIQLCMRVVMEAKRLGESRKLAFENVPSLRKEMQLDFSALALTSNEGERFWIEMLLHPLAGGNSVPIIEPRIRNLSSLQLQLLSIEAPRVKPSITEGDETGTMVAVSPASINTLPTPLSDPSSIMHKQSACMHKFIEPPNIMELFADSIQSIAVKLPPPNPEPRTEASSRPSNIPLRPTDLHKNYGTYNTTSPPTDTKIETEIDSPITSSISAEKNALLRNTEQVPSSRGARADDPIKETCLRLTAHKKTASVDTGPDPFSSLLDLVRKK